MARVFFGRLLAMTAFGCAVALGAGWVTTDRPTAWLARLAGDASMDPGASRAQPLGIRELPATPSAADAAHEGGPVSTAAAHLVGRRGRVRTHAATAAP